MAGIKFMYPSLTLGANPFPVVVVIIIVVQLLIAGHYDNIIKRTPLNLREVWVRTVAIRSFGTRVRLTRNRCVNALVFVSSYDTFVLISENSMLCNPLEITATEHNHKNSIQFLQESSSHVFLSHPPMCSQTSELNCTYSCNYIMGEHSVCNGGV